MKIAQKTSSVSRELPKFGNLGQFDVNRKLRNLSHTGRKVNITIG
jgi:hypothetical protein